MVAMESTLITAIATEVKEEMQLAPSVPITTLERHVREGEARLNNLIEGLEINFDTDLSARSTLKNYVRYAYYGAVDEFFKNYKGDIYDTQIRYL
jgi:hypothetical protein